MSEMLAGRAKERSRFAFSVSCPEPHERVSLLLLARAPVLGRSPPHQRIPTSLVPSPRFPHFDVLPFLLLLAVFHHQIQLSPRLLSQYRSKEASQSLRQRWGRSAENSSSYIRIRSDILRRGSGRCSIGDRRSAGCTRLGDIIEYQGSLHALEGISRRRARIDCSATNHQASSLHPRRCTRSSS